MFGNLSLKIIRQQYNVWIKKSYIYFYLSPENKVRIFGILWSLYQSDKKEKREKRERLRKN